MQEELGERREPRMTLPMPSLFVGGGKCETRIVVLGSRMGWERESAVGARIELRA